MARSTSPLGVEHYVQGHHDITGKAEVSDPSVLPTMKPMRNLHDASSIVSSRSTASHDYPPERHSAKQRLLDCQEQYESLARDLQNTDAAKEAAFWCGLGLGVVIASLPSSPNQLQSPLTPESRSGSSNSLATVSDSGFAPSVEVRTRHGLSLGDPDVENSITNLLGGLAGTFTSDVWDRHDPPHSLFPPDVGEGFDVVLSHFNLSRNQKIEDVITFVADIASRLLVLLQDEGRIVRSDVASYWELCLRVIAGSSDNGDAHVSNALQGQLIKRTPPASLREPALSYIIKPTSSLDEPHDLTPFPVLDPIPRAPHFAPRLQRQTRSRAASLMSHSSLRSFSSVRSLGGLSTKSPATLSLSHDFGFARSSSPTGSFAIDSPVSAYDSLDSLVHAHQLVPQQKRVLRSGNDRSITAPSSPLRPRAPTLSHSTSRYSAGSLKGKGKENVSQQPQEGLRPGPSNVSVRSGTRFVMTCPPTPSGGRSGPLPKMDPVLAALERSSKFKSKSLCLNCGKKGTNYPCCPRCGETWCSRECRIEANNGGKHVCKRSATMPSA